MEAKYKLKFTTPARDDLDGIYKYISQELCAGMAADILMDKIDKQLLRLRSFPMSGALLNDNPLRLKGYHKLPVENFLIPYVVDQPKQTIIIMRVFYNARNYERYL